MLGVLIAVSSRGMGQDKPVDLAQKADEAWLSLVDGGKYSESWKTASSAFQKAVTEEKWVSAMQSARAPLGKLLNRKLQSGDYTKTLPGAPDGEYVVVVYYSSFEHKETAAETVISVLEKDGEWRVAGYYIK
jgi:Protein of unknown function (DUF4019)